MKKFQIKTYGSADLSIAIQKKLFQLGYEWWFRGVRINDSDEISSIQVSKVGNMIWSPKASRDGFYHITLDELFAMTREPKETIKIGDSIYDKSEFEKATENLKPIK